MATGTSVPGTRLKESKVKFHSAVSVIDDVVVMYCSGRIVYHNEAWAFSTRLAEVLQHGDQLVLELSRVERIDGAGMGKLISALNSARERGSSIKLAAPERRIRSLLELTQLTSVFEIYETRDEAVMASRGLVV
jgi:anti-sigma B factor antagonist